jgi:RNA polymerase sigma factor (sigma-70 family)
MSNFDLDVLQLARAGDASAIASLLAQAQPDIRRYARHSCRNVADADDAVQETLWLLYRRVGTLRSLGSITAWLFSIVRRECIRIARRVSGMTGRNQAELAESRLDQRLTLMSAEELRLDVARAIESTFGEHDSRYLRSYPPAGIASLKNMSNL